MSAAPSNPGNFVGVQALRGAAAMLVVLCHASQAAHYKLGTGAVLFFGASGVDVFFPISGFVMAVTTHRYWGQAGRALEFLVRRLIRIVPLYWAATLLKALVVIALPGLTSASHLGLWHTLASLLFIPAMDADNRPFPVVPIGWTLNFEMFFYLLFALALALRLHPVLWLGGLLLVVSLLPKFPALGAIGTLADPILLEFVAGMFLGWATARGRMLPPRLAMVLLPAAFAALALTQWLREPVAFGWRLVVWGVPGTVALAAIIALEQPARRWLRGLPQRLGDASYAIYLSHGFVLPVVAVAFVKLHIGGEGGRWLLMLLCCVISASVGMLVHTRLERPVTRWLSDRWQRHCVRRMSLTTR